MKTLTVFLFVLVLVFGGTDIGNTAYIDFENTGLSNGDLLTTQIPGLSFNGADIFKESEFPYAFTSNDTIGGAPFSGCFISDLDRQPNENPNPIEVYFDNPVFNLSFVVADIDEEEGITARAFDISDTLLETVEFFAGDTGTGDRLGTLFEFNTTGISKLILTPSPSSDGGIGWGVDNISYDSTVPIPSAVWLFGSGLVGLVGLRKKSRK